MNPRWRYCAMLLVLPILATSVGAQPSTPQPAAHKEKKSFARAGVWELGGSLSFDSVTPVDEGETGKTYYLFTALPFAGFFVLDNLQVGANPLGVTIISDGDNTRTLLRMFGLLSYHFRTRFTLFPFIEGLAGYTANINSGDEATTTFSGFSWGGRAGIKFVIGENALVTLGVQYVQVTLNPEGATKRNGTNTISGTAGFGIWF